MKPSIGLSSCLLLTVLVCLLSCKSTPGEEKVKEPDTTKLLGNGFGINSATLIVKNLDSARNYYTNVLGFDLSKPEKFQQGVYYGTLMASVGFADASSLELVGIKDSAIVNTKSAFISNYLTKYEGARLFSFSTSSVDTTLSWLKIQGYKIDSVRTGRVTKEISKGWDWDNGGPQWRIVEIGGSNPPPLLPSFTQYTGFPYEELSEEWAPYVWEKYYQTANGVVGISSLKIVVNRLDSIRNEFKKMGLKTLETSDSTARFSVAHNQELYITIPGAKDNELKEILKTRGPGVYGICFEVKAFKETYDFLKKKLPPEALIADSLVKKITVLSKHAYGVQLEFKEQSKERAALAKIYDFQEGSKLDSIPALHASGLYLKYCALCHGKDREGYAADNAPSLRSHALMATTQQPRSAYNFIHHTISYGRSGTAMAPYAKDQGGPLGRDDIELLIQWLQQSSGVKKPIELKADPVNGDVVLGKSVYLQHCANCHGTKGEGVRAPALANPMFLATASDAFLRYTITEGRDSTQMPSFKDSLSKSQIANVTAFLRSRASGWDAPDAVDIVDPTPENYVLHPKNNAPDFKLREDLYISAQQLLKAIKDSARIIILDARSKAAWQQTRIPGAISVPYYAEPDKFIKDIPNDNTWVVAYCACPHAASTTVVNTLRRFGYKHTAILDEGILVWAQLGYPVQYGQYSKTKSKKSKG